MDASLFKLAYFLGSLISLIVNFAVLVAAIFALQHKMRQSVALIALSCVLGLIATCASLFLYTLLSRFAHSAPWINLGLQTLFMLHNILWAAGTILLIRELKNNPAPQPNP